MENGNEQFQFEHDIIVDAVQILNLFAMSLFLQFTVGEWIMLQRSDGPIKHLEGDIWASTNVNNGQTMWRCLTCFLDGRLPQVPYQDAGFCQIHLVGSSSLCIQRICHGCGSSPLSLKPAGHCWACCRSLFESAWDFNIATPRLLELRINEEFPRVGERAVYWRPLLPGSSALDVLRIQVHQDLDGVIHYLPENVQENNVQIRHVFLIQDDLNEDSGYES